MADKISYNNVRRAAKRTGLISISRAYGKELEPNELLQLHMAEHWKKQR